MVERLRENIATNERGSHVAHALRCYPWGMFGIGGSEILVILIVALLFLGPEKLPDAAKQISKGIRDLRKQTRALQQTIEDDEHIGGAIRDLKSALRGDELPARPVVPPAPLQHSEDAELHDAHLQALAEGEHESPHAFDDEASAVTQPQHVDEPSAVTQPQHVGEASAVAHEAEPELALIKPPAGETAAREVPEQNPDTAAHKHG